MGTFISSDALLWASRDFQRLPKDQILLLFLLAIHRVPEISYPRNGEESAFKQELRRYLGVTLDGETRFLNPFDGNFRANNYFLSTVMGRLLNGSHSWTQNYLTRSPASGWPAILELRDDLFFQLAQRSSAPYLLAGKRLSLLATAILYFKQVDLSELSLKNPQDLVNHYRSSILDNDPELIKLFELEDRLFWGDLFVDSPLDEKHLITAVSAGEAQEPMKTIKIYEADFEHLTETTSEGQSLADLVRELIRGKNHVQRN